MIVTFASLGHYGRLANGMFQIASTIGIARRNGAEVGFPPWLNYDHRDRFGSGEDIEVEKHFVNRLPRYDGPALPEYFVDWGYQDVNLKESVSLSGHMQSARYFEHCMDEIRWYFRMVDEPEPNDYCAIHVRLGDYDNVYHPRLGMEYYGPAMKLFSDARFLVFSDEIEAAKEIFGPGVEYSEGRDYLEDFKLMKRCRHFIIGNSSYSAMAAILGEAKDKRVVAPRPWFGPAATIRGESIYSPEWRVVNWQHANAREAIAV